MRHRIITWTAAILLLCALAAAAGCGNHRQEGGFTSITFAPDGPGDAGAIWLELISTDPGNGRFTLKVLGDGMKVYGVGGKLDFDTSLLSIEGIAAGRALEEPGFAVMTSVTPTNAGAVVGYTRSDKLATSADVRKDQAIGSVNFTVKKTGTARIAFDAERSRVMTHKLEKLEPVKWVGGTVTVK